MDNIKLFLKEAGFVKEEQQNAILRLSLLTGLADQINEIIKYIRNAKNQSFNGNLLSEIQGKTTSEISQYLKTHDLNDIFNFVGKDITEDEFNEIIVGFTQINWFGRSGERWNGIDISQKLKSFDEFNEINEEVVKSGVLETNQLQPELNNPVAVLGATISMMEKRLRYSFTLGLENEKIYFLVGNRPLNKTEKEIPGLLENVKRICVNNNLPVPENLDELTETHGAMFVADKINQERKLNGLKDLNFKFVDTPAYLNFENPTVSRPNTEATIRQFLLDTIDDNIDINKVVFISNGANVETQKIAVERVLAENGFENHSAIVKGENCSPTTKFSGVSGTMAGRLYNILPRSKYGTNSKLESQSKENFRNKVLSYTQGGIKSIVK